MPSWKDRIKIWERESVLNLERSGLEAGQVANRFSPFKRKIIAACIIALLPAYLATRYGAEQLIIWRYSKNQLQAHASYADSKPIRADAVTILPVTAGRWAAYTQVFNDNLDLSASNVTYQFVFRDNSGAVVASPGGKLFLLSGEKKYLVAPRIDGRSVVSGELSFSGVLWQKRLQIPQIVLRPDVPALFDETQPPGLAAQGVIFNDSPYSLSSVHLTILLYGPGGRVIGVNARDEFSLRPGERRAYKLTWPDLSRSQVIRTAVQAETNTLDPGNLRPSQ